MVAMDPSKVEAYLARIGHVGGREPTLETLRALHRAHLAAVPFENLDIHTHPKQVIRLDLAALFRKIVGERRGGFCYELNGLFADLLSSLGFEVELLSARVAHDTGGFGPEFDHLTLLVTAEGRRLADVGFGRSFHLPLSLDAPEEQLAEGLLFRAVEDEAGWRVESRAPDGPPTPEYAFTLQPRRFEEFVAMCDWQQSSPESHFTQHLVCSRPTARGRVSVSRKSLIITEGDERRETPLPDDAALRGALEEHFAIRVAFAAS